MGGKKKRDFDRFSGFHGDLNETYPVGTIDDESKKLIRTARECLDEAIKACKPGALFRDLGKIMYAPNGRAIVDMLMIVLASRLPVPMDVPL